MRIVIDIEPVHEDATPGEVGQALVKMGEEYAKTIAAGDEGGEFAFTSQYSLGYWELHR